MENIKLTEHFNLEVFTFSQVAVRNGIDNTPSQEIKNNLQLLCLNVLEPLEKKVGSFIISSGFRCEKLNIMIGGSKKSQHINGEAVDIIPKNMNIIAFFNYIKNNNISYDQLILEFGRWVHISWCNGILRKQALIAEMKNNKVEYLLG